MGLADLVSVAAKVACHNRARVADNEVGGLPTGGEVVDGAIAAMNAVCA